MYKYLILIIVCITFTSCNRKDKEDSTDQGNSPIEMNGEAYGSTFHIVYYNYNQNINDQIQEVLNEFDESVNTYIPDSYLSRFNHSNYGASAEEILIDMVRKSQNFNTESGGYFDPSVAPLSDLWGFSKDGGKHAPSQHKIDSVMEFVGLEKIKIHQDSLSKSDARVQLSFNAMTGYVNDMVATKLQQNNIENYLIEIGGEILAKGRKPNGEPWVVGIDSPVENLSNREIYTTLELHDTALATSGNYRKFYTDELTGQKIAHTINPITGKSETSNLLSVTVLAKSCAEADAMATATMAMPLEQAKEFAIQRSDLKFLLIWSDTKGQLKSEAYNGFTTLP